MTTVRLGDLFEVQIGYRPRDPLDGAGDTLAVAIADLDYDRKHIEEFPVPGPGRLWLGHLATVELESLKSSYGLTEGAVLFLSRGHRRVAVPISENYVQPWPPLWDQTVVLYYFFLLLPKSDIIRPEFFAWLVNEGPLRQQIDAMASGSHIPSVPKRDFVDLAVPIPPIEVQEKLVRVYELALQEQRLAERASELRRLLVNAACDQILNNS